MTTVGLLHPGQMGAAVAAQAVSRGHTVLWHPAGRSAASAERASEAGLEAVDDWSDLLDATEILMCICPPASARSIADRVTASGYEGVYVDANAISPASMHDINSTMRPGASVVDGSIIGPPPRADMTARLYLAGQERETVDLVAQVFRHSQVEPISLAGPPGAASALKMAFASFQKACRVLAAVAHALADDYDVVDALLAEANRMGSNILADRDYLPNVAARAWRWEPEMQEIADTMRSAGLPDDLARATAEALRRLESAKDNWHVSREQIFRLLHQESFEGVADEHPPDPRLNQ